MSNATSKPGQQAGVTPSPAGASKAPAVLKRARLRAVQRLEYKNRLVEPGEVFDYEGTSFPPEHIAVKTAEPVGPPAPAAPPSKKEAPPWTTAGYVAKANREAGAAEIAAMTE